MLKSIAQVPHYTRGRNQNQEFGQDDPSSRGAQVSTALNLLSNFMREIDDSELYLKVAQLKTLAERGVITTSPSVYNEFRKTYAVLVAKHA